MKLAPKIVGIEGRETEWFFYGEDAEAAMLRFEPSELIVQIRAEEHPDGIRMTGRCAKKGRGEITAWMGEERVRIPCAVFGEREFFLCMVISSNFHYGYDPSAYADVDITKKQIAAGTGFDKAVRELLPIYRKHHLPVTWLIDPIVGFFKKDQIISWHEEYGDDYGIMPTSGFFQDADNYNTRHTQEETDRFFARMKSLTEYQFPFYTQIAGIDQWVGSVGSHFVRSCEKVGIHGLWGLGFDHGTCDTSMFHRGCPWDVYKMDPEDYRRPNPDSPIWGFQWTTRDILNTVHTPGGTSGSVIFSTDADDILFHNILQTEKGYYRRMLEAYLENRDQNDCTVFLIHQEDHDAHHQEGNQYYEQFLDSVLPNKAITPATMQEITMWLDLKYPRGEHPRQMIRMEDILENPAHVVFNPAHVICGTIKKPEDWGNYPPILAYYDKDMQVIFEYGWNGEEKILPYRVFDYRKQYPFQEEGEWPQEHYGGIQEIRTDQDGVTIISTEEYEKMPLLLNGCIRCCDIRKGVTKILY